MKKGITVVLARNADCPDHADPRCDLVVDTSDLCLYGQFSGNSQMADVIKSDTSRIKKLARPSNVGS